MNDVSSPSAPSTSGSPAKDAPNTFSQRGASVPFTTPELLWARVRQKGAAKELLVPGLAQTRGIFVYDWSTLAQRFPLSLHDRLLAKEILIGPTPTPESVAAATLRITGSGAAGAEAKEATTATAQQMNTLSLHLRLHLTQRIVERLGSGDHAKALAIDDLATAEGLRKTTDALAAVAHVYGMSGPALYGRIEGLANVLAPVGLGDMPMEAPNRRLVHRLEQLARTLSTWAEADHDNSEAEARFVARVAAECARIATHALRQIDEQTAAVELLLTEWQQGSESLRASAERVVWILDGWQRFLRVWENASTLGAEAQSKALVLMSYIVPLVPPGELPSADRAAWVDLDAELSKIIAAHEEGVDLQAAVELLGAEGAKPLAGVTVAAKAPPGATRRRGLASDKLTQVVRILEPAMDRPDGAPAQKMLDELRPQLVEVRPPRARRARRVVCDAFQELLIDGETSGKIASRIPRSVIGPAWALFQERVDKDAFAAVEKKLDDPGKVSELWQLFIKGLKPDLEEAAAFTSKSRALIVRLGGEAHFHALENMVGAVSVAEELARLRAVLPPPPIAEFTEADLDRLAPVLNDIRKANPTQVQTALSIVMSRMKEPWAISRVLETLATTGRFRSSAGVTGFVATAMIGQLEGRVEDVRKLAESGAAQAAPERIGEATMALAQSIQQCAESVAGTDASLAVSGSPTQVEDVATLRSKVCDLVGSKMGGNGALPIVSALTGAPAARSENGVRPGTRWRFDQPLDPAALRSAELYAGALRQSVGSATLLGVGEKVTAAIKQTLEELEKTAAVLFGQMRTAQLDLVTRDYARGHVTAIAYLVEILADADRAERVLTRGLEAIG